MHAPMKEKLGIRGQLLDLLDFLSTADYPVVEMKLEEWTKIVNYIIIIILFSRTACKK